MPPARLASPRGPRQLEYLGRAFDDERQASPFLTGCFAGSSSWHNSESVWPNFCAGSTSGLLAVINGRDLNKVYERTLALTFTEFCSTRKGLLNFNQDPTNKFLIQNKPS